MRIIDLINVGQAMPSYIPDFEAKPSVITKKQIVSVQISEITDDAVFVPYLANNINMCEITANKYHQVFSSRFSGCWMAYWKKKADRRICVGHVQTGGDYDCKDVWRQEMASCSSGYAYPPSDVIPTETASPTGWNCYGYFFFSNDFDAFAAYSIVTKNNIVTQKVLVHKGTII